MQPLKNKILKGFFTNVGADPFINWINEVFKTTKVRYCNLMHIISKETADFNYNSEYRVTKADNKSLLFIKKDSYKKQSIIINISEVPELLNIKPNDLSIFCTNTNKDENIKILFGQLLKIIRDDYTYINNVLLTIDKKTGTIIDKEIISKFLISDVLPF